MRVELSRLAQRDIVEILAYGITEFGERQALAYHQKILALFERLGAYPELGREHKRIRKPIRTYVHKSHVVIYRADRDVVHILRVMSGRQDWQQLL